MKHFYKVVILLFMTISLQAQVDISCEGNLSVAVGGSVSGDSLTISGVTTDNMCDPASGDVTGSVDITVEGGTPPYVYSWTQDNGVTGPQPYATTEDLDNLVAGTYCVTVTSSLTPAQIADGVLPTSADCIVEACYVITQPPPVTLSLDTDPLTCNEYNATPDGQVDATAGGGVPGYLYEWEYEGSYADNLVNASGAPNTNPLATQVSLPAGWYFVTVYDTQGCEANDSIEITQPDSLLLSADLNEPDCNTASTPALEGGIDITLTNGVGPFTYSWTGTVTSSDEDLTGLGTGTYTVLVTDSNGCTVTDTYELTEPEPVAIAGTPDEPDCNAGSGALDGGISIVPSGGTGTDGEAADDPSDYTYAWTGTGVVAASQNQTNLGTGTYNVTVTDFNGCTATEEFILTEPEAIAVNGTPDQPDCNAGSGALDGSIAILPTGGTGAYTYAWTGTGVSAAAQDQSGLGAGTYNVTVTDVNGCSATEEYILTEPEAVAVNGTPDEPDCNAGSGALDGSIAILPTGGTGAYTYAWTGTGVSAAAQDQSGLGSGTYNVTVTDVNGCSATEEYVLTEPEAVAVNGTPDQPDCNAGSGALDGSIAVLPTGGTGAYTYAWTGTGVSAAAQDQSGLGAGTYNVTVTDVNGCSATEEYILTEPEAVAVNGTPDQPDCNAGSGALDGSIAILPTGGTGAYTYAWTGTGVAAAAQDQSGLGAGTYNVTVTDVNGCSATEEYVLTEPEAVAVNGTPDQPDCNAGSGALDGSIAVLPTGGTGAYTYAWTGPGVAAAAQDQSGLGAGTYNVTVTDVNGCSATEEYILTEPEAVAVNGTPDQPDCNAGSGALDGSIAILPTGGTGAYTYAWTGTGVAAAAQDQSGLGAGTYNVTVTDVNGCSATEEYILTEPEAVAVNGTPDQPDCNAGSGALDGSIAILPTGGTGAYTYAWTGTGVAAAAQDQSGLGAGTYNVTVTDVNGCSATEEYILTEPEAVAVNGTPDQPDCNAGSGALDGSIAILPTGGTGAYTYAWTGTGVAAAAQDQSGLGAGTYNVTVTDVNGCSATEEYILTEPEAVAVNGTPDQPDCNAGSGALDGSIAILPTGGTGAYTYAWTGTGVSAAAQDQSGLGAGTYNVTVTDVNGCSATEEYILTEPEAVAVNGTPDQPDCNAGSGALDGSIAILPTGGTGAYTYAWTGTGVSAAAQDQSGLGAGTYNVTVTDVNGCSATEEYILTEPEAVAVNGTPDQPDCNAGSGALDGAVALLPTGGTGAYTYAWTGPGVAAAAQDQSGLGAGTYNVTVTDVNGCSATEEYILTEPEAVAVNGTPDQPDCNAGSGALDGAIAILPTGGTGAYTYAWTGTGVSAAAQDQSGLGAGTYNVTVTDVNGCSATEEYILTEPEAVAVNGTPDQPDCNAGSGALDGAIAILPTGGTGTYTYAWTGPGVAAAAQDQSGLGAGTYNVTVTDVNGCSATEEWIFTEPDAVVISLDMTPLTCNAALAPTDGTVTVTFAGGTGTDGNPANDASDYTFTWGDDGVGESGTTLSNLPIGTYSVTVTDENGCSDEATIDVTQPATIDIVATDVDPDCHDDSGAATGSITLNSVVGGTGTDDLAGDDFSDYEFNWAADVANIYANNLDLVGTSVTTQTGLTAGTYYLTVTDENGCTKVADYELDEPTPITVVGSTTQPACNDDSGDLTGAIDITAGGGIDDSNTTPTYTYSWTGDGVNATAEDQTGLGEGWYYVTVYDGLCSANDSFNLTEPDPVVCVLENTPEGGCNDILCAGGVDTIFVVPSGGTAPYTYMLDAAAAVGDSFFIVGAGTYTVTTIDANNCTSTCDITLDEPNPLAGGTCTLDDDCQIGEGQIEVAATGGCAPYTVTWTSPTGGTLTPDPNDVNGNGDAVIATEGGSTIFTGAEGGETYNFVITDVNGCQIP